MNEISYTFLLKNNRNYTFQNLILSLDLQSQKQTDYSDLIKVCLEKKLMKALIYLCTENSDDFFIPLIQMFNLTLENQMDEYEKIRLILISFFVNNLTSL